MAFFFRVSKFGYVLCFSSKQLLEQEDVDVLHPLDKDKGITLEDFKLIKMHMANCMISLSLSLSNAYFMLDFTPIFCFCFDEFQLL